MMSKNVLKLTVILAVATGSIVGSKDAQAVYNSCIH
jgi:NhaP-type Na+/H+ and K+/H+ antiporter